LLGSKAPQIFAPGYVSFYVGKVDGTIVSKDGVWEITHILIVGIGDHGGIAAVQPTPKWIAIAVPSEAA
jgi:hypothetical protein